MPKKQPVPRQIVKVYGQSQEQAYSRIVPMREVTFTCRMCGRTVTQLRYPSRLPHYCSDTCKALREEQRKEERVRKQREKRQRERESRTQTQRQRKFVPTTRKRLAQRFQPGIAAAWLANGRRQLIGMLIPSFTWPLIPELMRGVAEMLEQTSYELVLYSMNDADLKRDRSEVINRVLATQLTAGLLAVFPGQASQDLTRLYHQGFPVVIVDDQLEQTTPWVGVDNTTGAYLVVRHLVQLGHRRIAHIAGPHEYLASHDRYNGYRQALLEAGIPLDPDLVLEGDFLPPTGRACASKFFQLPREKRPTAIFAATDQMAYGVLAAAEEFGIAIPQEVALVGFDDDEPSVHVRPPLTTVRQPYYEMGAQGLKLLLSLLDSPGSNNHSTKSTSERGAHPGEDKPVRIQLTTGLVVRASCGADYRISIPTLPGNDVI
jgi:LacI family transcriptional regulator